MERIDSRIRIGILACIGGFATGLVSCTLYNALRKRKHKEEVVTSDWKFGEMMFNEGNDASKKDPANFSDITALVGSVSDSHVGITISIFKANYATELASFFSQCL